MGDGRCLCGVCVVCGSSVECVGCGTQVSSGASGAAHALNENAGVFRCAGCVQKSLVDQKGEKLACFFFC